MKKSLTLSSLVLVSAAAWGAFVPAPPVIALLVWLAALVLPGVAVLVWTSVPVSPALDRLWIALVAGPVVFGYGMCLGRLTGLSVAASGFAVIALSAGAVVGGLARNPGAGRSSFAPPPPATGNVWERKPWLLPLLVAAAMILLGALPSLVHEPLRLRDDARLHLPVIARVLAGSFPPENPFLAGEPLAYFWFYHVTLAGVVRLGNLSPDLTAALFNAHALTGLMFALDAAGRRLRFSGLERAAALAFFGLGLTPWGWIRLAFLHITNPDLNWALVKATGVAGLFPILSPTDPRLVASLTKIAITNTLPISLALALAAAIPVTPGPRRGSVLTAVLISGCLLFHLVTGILLCAGLAVRWVLGRVTRSSDTQTGWRPGRPIELIATAAGVFASLPYVLSVLQARTGTSAVVPGWQGMRGLELHLALAGMAFFCLVAGTNWIRDPVKRSWLAVGIPAFTLPFIVHLVDGNEYKGVFFLFAFLTLPAAAGLVRLSRGRLWIAGLMLLPFTVTPFLAARAYITESPSGAVTQAMRREIEAAASRLPRDAVVWRPEPGRGYSAFTYPLDRPSYLSDPYALQILGQWESEEARWRRGSLRLVSGDRVTEALAAAADRVRPRPLVVLVTTADSRRFPGLDGALAEIGATPLAGTRQFSIYGFSQPPQPGSRQDR